MEKKMVPRGTDKAYLKVVIVTEALKGEGIKEDPVRTLYQYWDLDGTLLAVKDPCN